MTMTDDEIARLRELLEKATPGPWSYRDMMPNTYGPAFVDGPDVQDLAICGDGVRRSETHGFCLKMHDGESEANAALIVALRNNASSLLAERAALKEELKRAAKTKIVDCGPDLKINRDHLVSLSWDRRHYMNGSSSTLVITMIDGAEHRIEYWPGGYGPDAYEIERRILHG